jgi:ArsR family transcriptional regulator
MRNSAVNTAAPIDKLEEAFKALADRTRLRILALLGNNEVCVCHIHDSLGLPQPTVSRHLAYLRRSGLVAARRDGVWMHYRVSTTLEPAVQQVVNAAVHALSDGPTTSKDRRQFQRSFGQLYVMNSGNGGSCCSPRG